MIAASMYGNSLVKSSNAARREAAGRSCADAAQIELAFVNIRLAVRNIRLATTMAELNAANNLEARLKDADKLFETLIGNSQLQENRDRAAKVQAAMRQYVATALKETVPTKIEALNLDPKDSARVVALYAETQRIQHEDLDPGADKGIAALGEMQKATAAPAAEKADESNQQMASSEMLDIGIGSRWSSRPDRLGGVRRHDDRQAAAQADRLAAAHGARARRSRLPAPSARTKSAIPRTQSTASRRCSRRRPRRKPSRESGWTSKPPRNAKLLPKRWPTSSRRRSAASCQAAVAGDFSQRVDLQGKTGLVLNVGTAINSLCENVAKALDDLIGMLKCARRGRSDQAHHRAVPGQFRGAEGECQQDGRADRHDHRQHQGVRRARSPTRRPKSPPAPPTCRSAPRSRRRAWSRPRRRWRKSPRP